MSAKRESLQRQSEKSAFIEEELSYVNDLILYKSPSTIRLTRSHLDTVLITDKNEVTFDFTRDNQEKDPEYVLAPPFPTNAIFTIYLPQFILLLAYCK